jgi:hypothetical protein
MAITQEKLAELRQQHGKVLHLKKTIEEDEYEAVFRRATKVEFKKCVAEQGQEETAGSALDNLVLGCCLFPDRDGIGQMLNEAPGLAYAFGNAIMKATGLGQAEVLKK